MRRKKAIMVGSIVLSTIMLLNGCKADVSTNDDVTFTYTDQDLNNFVTDENLDLYDWYVIETFDGDNTELKITKKSTMSKITKNIYEYYYTDVIKQDYKVYSVLYDYEEKEFWVETGPDIISAVPLTDYLNEYNLRKASYSKEEIKQILSMINDDYQKKKELEGKGKVLIKDNSMY
ncbi:MAG: hypothetical protein ACI4U0_05650 [Candidatus Aphodocola sp.]